MRTDTTAAFLDLGGLKGRYGGMGRTVTSAVIQQYSCRNSSFMNLPASIAMSNINQPYNSVTAAKPAPSMQKRFFPSACRDAHDAPNAPNAYCSYAQCKLCLLNSVPAPQRDLSSMSSGRNTVEHEARASRAGPKVWNKRISFEDLLSPSFQVLQVADVLSWSPELT